MSECNLVYEINRVHILEIATGCRVHAFATASSNATNARLVLSSEPSAGNVLRLDFCVDDGQIPVLTPVEAYFPFDCEAFDTVMVRGATNEITVPIYK